MSGRLVTRYPGLAIPGVPNNLTVTGGETKAERTANLGRNSTVALADDPQLQLAIPALTFSARLDLMLFYEGTAAGDLKIGFTGPAGMSLDWFPLAIAASVGSGGSGSGVYSLRDITGNLIIGTTGAGTALAARVSGYLKNTGTAGILILQWAQGTSDPGDTIIYARSNILLHRAP